MNTHRIFEIVSQPLRVELPDYRCGKARRRDRRAAKRKHS